MHRKEDDRILQQRTPMTAEVCGEGKLDPTGQGRSCYISSGGGCCSDFEAHEMKVSSAGNDIYGICNKTTNTQITKVSGNVMHAITIYYYYYYYFYVANSKTLKLLTLTFVQSLSHHL